MLRLAILIWIMLGVTLAGTFMIVVMTVPSLSSQDMRLIPVAAGLGFVVAMPAAFVVAKRIMAMTRKSSGA